MYALWRTLVFPDAAVDDIDIDSVNDVGSEVSSNAVPDTRSHVPLMISLLLCSLFTLIVIRNLSLFTLILGLIGFTFLYR